MFFVFPLQISANHSDGHVPMSFGTTNPTSTILQIGLAEFCQDFHMYDGMTFQSKFHTSNIFTSNIHPIIIQCEAPKIAKLVYNSHFTMVYGTYNYSYWGL